MGNFNQPLGAIVFIGVIALIVAFAPRLIKSVRPDMVGTKGWVATGVLCVLWIGIYAGLGQGSSLFGSGAPFDEATTFNNAFAAPIGLTVPAESGGAVSASPINGPCIVEQLFQSKALTYAPMPDAEPWVQLSMNGSPLSDATVQVFSGTRQFASAQDRERFQRNGNDYFAETVTYYVSGTSPLSVPSPGFGPFTSRVVYVRDPALGRWAVETPVSNDESVSIGTSLSGRPCATNAKDEQRKAAFDQAMTVIEGRLTKAGLLERTPDRDIVLSPARNLAVFKGWARDLQPAMNHGIVDDYGKQKCAGLHKGDYHWRLPTDADFNKILTDLPRSGPSRKAFIDTPDARFWGDINPTSQNSDFFVEDTQWNQPWNLRALIIEQGGALYDSGVGFSNGRPRLMCVADIHPDPNRVDSPVPTTPIQPTLVVDPATQRDAFAQYGSYMQWISVPDGYVTDFTVEGGKSVLVQCSPTSGIPPIEAPPPRFSCDSRERPSWVRFLARRPSDGTVRIHYHFRHV